VSVGPLVRRNTAKPAVQKGSNCLLMVATIRLRHL
jgi:hypothetical protein